MSARELSLTLCDGAQMFDRSVAVDHAVIAGWTGRDKAALEAHIRELAALGVAPPASTPIYYRVAAARLTTADVIEVIGDRSGGEVEAVLLKTDGRLWVGVGSDHTDREVETYGVTVSKQMCDKPVAPVFWAFDDVAPHWDQLVLRAWVTEGGARVAYQAGTVDAMLDPETLMAGYTGGGAIGDGTVMFCGTLAATGGVRPTTTFEIELEDPVRGRRIAHSYTARNLAIAG